MNFEMTFEWFWINERDWTWIFMNQTDFFWIWANPGCFIFELTHLSSFFFDRHFENQYRLRNCESDLGGQGLTLNESQYEPRDSCERLHRNIIKMFINIIKIIDVILQLFPSWSLFRSTSPCDRFSSYRDANLYFIHLLKSDKNIKWGRFLLFYKLITKADINQGQLNYAHWKLLEWSGYIDVGDEMCWWHLWDFGDSFGHFGHQHQLSSTNIKRCHQHRNSVTNIHKSS